MIKILTYKYRTLRAICAILFCGLLCACNQGKGQIENKDINLVVKERLSNNPESVKMSIKKHIIEAGDSMCVELPRGNNAVYNFSADLRGDSKDIVIKASFDGVERVVVPFSYYSSGSTIDCNELMPYEKNSKFKIINCSANDIDATLSIKTIPISWDNKLSYYSVDDNKSIK